MPIRRARPLLALVALVALVLLAVLCAPAAPAGAQGFDRVWDGGGADDDWGTPANWDLDLPLAVGNNFNFPAGVAKLAPVNDFPEPSEFHSIWFGGDGYVLTGNEVTLTNGITTTNTAGVNRVELSVRLDPDTPTQMFRSTNAGTTLRVTKGPPGGNQLRLSNRSLVVTGSGDTEILGTILNQGDITKVGPGTLTLGGAEGASVGFTTIDDGVLRLMGDGGQRVVAVSGGRLETFTTASAFGLAASGGAVAPGDADGPTGVDSLVINGSVGLVPGSSYEVDVNGPAAHDAISATVSVSLGGALVVQATAAPAPGEVLRIIDNQGPNPVSGVFAGLPEGSVVDVGGRAATLSYAGGDGNDVVLTAAPDPPPPPPPPPPPDPPPPPPPPPGPPPTGGTPPGTGLAVAPGAAVPAAPAAPLPTRPAVVNRAPVLSAVRASPATFALGSALPALLRSARRTPTGTTLRFTLSEAARTTFTFQQALTGRRVGRSCLADTRARRARPRCTRYVTRGSFAVSARPGANAVRFQGRLSARRRLGAGTYRVLSRAVDAGNLRSAQRTTTLRVIGPTR